MTKSKSVQIAEKVANAVKQCFDSESFYYEFLRKSHNDVDLQPFEFLVVSMYQADPEALKLWVEDTLALK